MRGFLLLTAIVAGTVLGDWKSDANERIERYRKGGLVVAVTDGAGKPVMGAEVVVEMVRHDYRFGTAVASGVTTNTGYWNIVRDNFNFAVCENAMKWGQCEGTRDRPGYGEAEKIYAKCAGYGIPLRGHCLTWGRSGASHDPSWVQNLGTADLEAEVKERVKDAVGQFKGRVMEWDFNNEMIANPVPPDAGARYRADDFYTQKLGTGITNRVFTWAGEVDPSVRLTFNEFGVLGEKLKAPLYADMVRFYLESGVPRDRMGVNFQGHMSETPSKGEHVDPDLLWQNVQTLAGFGLPMQITEFDYDHPDENARADGLEAVYRVFYSHPLTVGIIMWGFWDQRHWKPIAALWKGSGFSITTAGKRYRDLVYREWWTNENLTSGSDGVVRLRAFYGEYRITVRGGGRTASYTLSFPPGEAPRVGGAGDPNLKISATADNSAVAARPPKRGATAVWPHTLVVAGRGNGPALDPLGRVAVAGLGVRAAGLIIVPAGVTDIPARREVVWARRRGWQHAGTVGLGN